MTVLVAGGTGRLGRLLVDALLGSGQQVRVLTRSGDAARALRARGAEVVVGNAERAADADAALTGCTTVLAAMSGFSGAGGASPRSVDRDATLHLIRAAGIAGARRFVLVSTRGAARQASLELDRMKYAAEEALRASALDWTIVRAAPFLETQLDAMSGPLAATRRTMIFGSPTTVVNLVPVQEVADVVLAAAVDSRAVGEVVELSGEPITLQAMSDALHAAAGTEGRTRRIPLGALRTMAIAARPFNPFLARAAAAAVAMNSATYQAGAPNGAPRSARSRRIPLADALAAGAAAQVGDRSSPVAR